ncbi:MAG: type IV pilus modification protein PilV [Azoarcus sp.]|nr:type IV pilus modification protein PilV [Azoarcus sp.]
MCARKHRIQQEGFTMIEVLVTIVILSLGLLGLAGLQISSLKMSQSAGARSVASQYAYAMLDKIRSNKGYAHHYACGDLSSCLGLPVTVDDDIKTFLNQLKGETSIGSNTFGSLPNATVRVYRRSNADVPTNCLTDDSDIVAGALSPTDVFVVCIAWDQGWDERLGIGSDPSASSSASPGDQIVWAAGRLW